MKTTSSPRLTTSRIASVRAPCAPLVSMMSSGSNRMPRSSEIVRALSGVEPAQERCYEVRRVILHESLEAPEVTCHPAAHQPERGGESFEPASRLERDPHPNDGPRESDG